MPDSPARPSALLPMTITGVVSARSQRLISSSSGVIPARASIRNSAASASRTAASVCCRIRPGSVWASSSSKPAVSISRKSSPSSFASPSRRSRVTPGRSSTSATRLPTSRLNSVDLPTFGRPMIATVGRGMERATSRRAASLRAGYARNDCSAKRAQTAVVVVNVECRIRDDWRQADRSAHRRLALERTGRGIDVDDGSGRAGDDEAPAGEHRTRIFDLTLLALRVNELGQLVDPADVPVEARDAEQFRIVGDDKNPVAGDPRSVDSGDIELPHALAGGELERDHAPALPDRENLAVVDHRIGIDVRQRRDARTDAGALQRVLPDLAPVLVTIRV